MITPFQVVIWVAQAALLLLVVHLWAPVVIRTVLRHRHAAMVRGDAELPWPNRTTFKVLVPAHSEALVIDRLLLSLTGQTYPRDKFEVIVVSDNSTDDTADRARRFDVTCFERTSAGPSNKAQALQWLWRELQSRRAVGANDVIVIVDADCVVESDFLAQLDRAFSYGAEVVQGHRRVEVFSGSAIAELDAVMEEIRQQFLCGARRLVGLSAYLLGSGVAFKSRIFTQLMNPVNCPESITEDQVWQRWLIERDIEILWWPNARLGYETVATMGEFRKQRARWVGDRVRGMLRGLPMIWQGLWRGNHSLIDHGLSKLQPPRSALAALTIAMAGLANVSPSLSLLPWWGWLSVAASFGLYVLAGFIALKPPLETYASLLHAPRLVGQITWISLLTVLGQTTTHWDAVKHGLRRQPNVR